MSLFKCSSKKCKTESKILNLNILKVNLKPPDFEVIQFSFQSLVDFYLFKSLFFSFEVL